MITPAFRIEAFMGGVGLGLTVMFLCFLLTLGAALIRRMVDE